MAYLNPCPGCGDDHSDTRQCEPGAMPPKPLTRRQILHQMTLEAEANGLYDKPEVSAAEVYGALHTLHQRALGDGLQRDTTPNAALRVIDRLRHETDDAHDVLDKAGIPRVCTDRAHGDHGGCDAAMSLGGRIRELVKRYQQRIGGR